MCCEDVFDKVNLIAMRVPLGDPDYEAASDLLVRLNSTCCNTASSYGHAIELASVGINMAKRNSEHVQKAYELIKRRTDLLEKPL